MGKSDPSRMRDPFEPQPGDPQMEAFDGNAPEGDGLEDDDFWMDDEPLGDATPPNSVRDALDRAARHGKAAAAETLAALRALLDAAALARTGRASDTDALLGPLASWLEDLGAKLATDAGRGSPEVLAALADALDHEISRWEQRARSDSEARAVLRAFLGVRELLWEFGVRRADTDDESESDPHDASPEQPSPDDRPARRKRKRRRVQRVRVEG